MQPFYFLEYDWFCLMLSGIWCALGACTAWSLIFVVPSILMSSFSYLEIAIARFFVFGIISSSIAFYNRKRIGIIPKKAWKLAIFLSLFATYASYAMLVIGTRYSSCAVSTLIFGISPIYVSIYFSIKNKTFKLAPLITSSLLSIFGLILVNITHIEFAESIYKYMYGLCASVLSLIAWTFFIIKNTNFLRMNKNVNPVDWSTLIGVTSLIWTFLFSLVLFVLEKFNFIYGKQRDIFDSRSIKFIIGGLILGCICSWLASILWNVACSKLPGSVSGQMMISESVIGVILVFFVEKHLPMTVEIIGIASIIIGTIISIRSGSSSVKTH